MADDDPNPKPGDEELDDSVEAEEDEAPEGEDAEEEPAEAAEGEDEGEGDEPEGEDEEAGDEEPPAEPPRRRANETIRELRARARRAEEERDRYVRERAGTGADPDKARRDYEAAEAQRLEQARLEGPEKVAEYYYQRSQRENAARINGQANMQFEREDSREFRSLQREIPAYARVKDWVEDYIAKQRAMGNYAISREAVAKYRLGELAIERAANGGGKRQRDSAERRIERQRVRAPSGGSDVQRPARTSRNPDAWSVEDWEKNAGNIPLGTIR